MVIVLKQTSENGKRFVSTLVEAEEQPSFNSSNFSFGSEKSISERSAIYKQRIDSLFGRHTRLNPFKPHLDPFCVRISGNRVQLSHLQESPLDSMDFVAEKPDEEFSSDDDDDYQKIQEKRTIMADSLSERKKEPNVSSVNIIREDKSETGHEKGPWRGSCPTLRFPVEYLGSVQVEGSTTALQDLQAPLRALYVGFLTGTNVLSGELSITAEGLRFESPKLRLVNPFTTIAVWAAIKFVARGDVFPTECAFMPLISDPEGQDKGRLFEKMDGDLAKVYLSCVNESRAGFRNPPIFACVMREASFTLDCHAFACKCAEDAIVVAANLYQSLVDKMRTANKEGESGYGSLTRNSPANTNSSPHQNRSSSSASSSPIEGNEAHLFQRPTAPRDHRVVFSDSESVIPVRPPRRKKKIGDGKKFGGSEESLLQRMPSHRKPGKGLKRQKRVQIFTPEETSSDSFNESIDAVLDRIINPGGMSFNDLKPAYQEIILKIALTLTQDQLYQKSKEAMKKHQVQFRKKGRGPEEESSQFLNHLLKSLSKITSSKVVAPAAPPKRLKPSLVQRGKKPVPPKILKKPHRKPDEPVSFCSGCMCESCSDKCYCSLPSKHNVKIVGLPPTTCPKTPTDTPDPDHHTMKKTCGYDTDSCAESEKCYCSLQRVKSNGLKIYNINLDTETSDTDTNSYDFEPFNQTKETPSTLKTNNSRSVEILSYHPSKRGNLSQGVSPAPRHSPSHVTTTNALVHLEDNSGLLNRSPRQNSSKNYNNSAGIFNRKMSPEEENGGEKNKILLCTGSSPSTRVIYQDQRNGEFERSGKKESNSRQRRGDSEELEEDNTSSEDLPDRENILSMKKTAEIAAMFTNLRIEKQGKLLNPIHEIPNTSYESTHNKVESNPSIDFESSLGYLP